MVMSLYCFGFVWFWFCLTHIVPASTSSSLSQCLNCTTTGSSGDAVETRSEAQSLLAAEEEAGCGHQANTKSQPSNQHLTTSDSRQQSRDAGYVRVDRQGSKTLRQREHHAVGLDKSAGAQPPVSTSSSFSSYGGLHPGGDAKPIAGTAQHEQFELPSSSSGHAQSSYSADAQLESPAKSVLRHESTSECAGRDSVNVRLTQIHNSLRKSSAHPKPGVQKLRMGSGLDSEPQKSTELFRSTEPRATAGSSPQPEPAPAQHKSSGQRSAAGAAAGTSLLSPDTGLADQGDFVHTVCLRCAYGVPSQVSLYTCCLLRPISESETNCSKRHGRCHPGNCSAHICIPGVTTVIRRSLLHVWVCSAADSTKRSAA